MAPTKSALHSSSLPPDLVKPREANTVSVLGLPLLSQTSALSGRLHREEDTAPAVEQLRWEKKALPSVACLRSSKRIDNTRAGIQDDTRDLLGCSAGPDLEC